MSVMTAEDVACALVAASKETGADPVVVAMGVTNIGGGKGGDFSIAHARAYAALALAQVFPESGNDKVSRAVGAKSGAYVRQIEAQLGRSNLAWWDCEAFARVREALRQRLAFAKIVDAPAEAPARASSFEVLRESGRVPMRRAYVPDCEDVTAEFFGDPPPGRSALDQKRKAELA